MRFTRAEPDGGSVSVVLTLLSFGFSEASSRRRRVNTDSWGLEWEGWPGPPVNLGMDRCVCTYICSWCHRWDEVSWRRVGAWDLEQMFSNLRELQNQLKGLQKADCWAPPPEFLMQQTLCSRGEGAFEFPTRSSRDAETAGRLPRLAVQVPAGRFRYRAERS